MALAWTLRDLLAGSADMRAEAAAEIPVDVTVTDITLDSRSVRPGSLFLACAGSQCHGLEFAAQAVAAGAAAIAWEPSPGIDAPDCAIPSVTVPELHARAGELASRFFGEPSHQLALTGITGTDGKTSTAYLLAQAFGTLGQPCEYIGTLGSGTLDALESGRNTTPDAVSVQRLLAQAQQAGVGTAALEVSSHALDQGRANGLRFTATVLTNIGRDHLDYHGDMGHYVAAKRRLFGRTDGGAEPAPAILNRDDARGRQFADELNGQCPVVLYGLGGERAGGADVLGCGLVTHARGLSLEVVSGEASAVLDSDLLGRFNAYNLLAVIAVLRVHGVALADACAALSSAHTVPGRAEAFHGPRSDALVVVDYAHTPQALANILAALRPHTAGRLVCIFGCGGNRDRGKRPLMARAAASGADRLVITDDNPRHEDPATIVEDIRAGLPKATQYTICRDRRQAMCGAVAAARSGDVILVAGKGHEDYQIFGDERRSFSDRALAAELVGVELAA